MKTDLNELGFQVSAKNSDRLQQRNTELENEVIAGTAQLQEQLERARLISSIALRIRQSLSLDETINATVKEVRQLLECDRVLLYQLWQDGTGTVVQEAVVGGWSSLLGRSYPAEFLPQEYHQLYVQGRIRALDDVHQDDVSHCVREFLQHFEAKAKLVVPIIQGEELWGLLIAHHCSEPRYWQALEIDLLQELATHIAIALKQASLYEQAQTDLKERKLAEEKVEQLTGNVEASLSLLCATLDSTADGILVVNHQRKIVSFNHRFVEMWGIPESVLESRNHDEEVAFVQEQLKDPEGFIQKVNEMYSQPDVHSQHLLECKDGRYFERYTQSQHQQGQTVGIVISFRDITERKLAAAALLHAHEQLETKVEERTAQLKQANEQLHSEIAERKKAEEELLERSRQAALNADIGIALTQNNTLQDILRQCAEALVQHLDGALARIWTINHQENVFELQASAGIYTHINGNHSRVPIGKCKISLPAIERQPHLTNALIGDPLVHNQEWAVREEMVGFAGYPLIVDRQVVAVMAIFARQPLTDDTIQAMASVAHEIALCIQRQQVELALRESEERFRNLIETSSDWVWEIDENAVYTYVCPRVYDVLGYEPEEVLGKTCWDLMPLEEARRLANILAPITATQTPFNCIEYTNIHNNGHLIVLETSGVPFFDADGKFRGYRGMNRDITKRKQTEAEVLNNLEKEKELNELKSHFITTASHEFRTPLTKILLASELLQHYDHKLGDDKRLTRLNQIQTAVKGMVLLLDDVLAIGKASAGRLEFKPAFFDLEAVCRNVLEEISLTTASKLTWRFNCQGQNTLVEMDEKLIRQMLSNLLSNAGKYSKKEGTVCLELLNENNQAIFKIIDEGIGIPESDRSRLFEAFHRASNVSNISGTGLGLAIVKNAVDLHGGKITVESELGVGTTFTVWIPTIQIKDEAK